MFKRILFFAYGSLSYLIFMGTFLYTVCFIGDWFLLETMFENRPQDLYADR